MRAFTRRISSGITAAFVATAVLAATTDAQEPRTPSQQPTPSTQAQDPSQPGAQTPSTQPPSTVQPQSGTRSQAPSARVQASGSESRDDGSGSWGWLGLLGLAGLLGFRRRSDTYTSRDASRS